MNQALGLGVELYDKPLSPHIPCFADTSQPSSSAVGSFRHENGIRAGYLDDAVGTMVLSSYGEPEVETTDANYFIAIPSYHPSGVTYGGVLVS